MPANKKKDAQNQKGHLKMHQIKCQIIWYLSQEPAANDHIPVSANGHFHFHSLNFIHPAPSTDKGYKNGQDLCGESAWGECEKESHWKKKDFRPTK